MAIQEYYKLGLEVAEGRRFTRIELMNIGGKKRKSGSKDGLHTMVSKSKREGKYLVLLQVNCRSIYNTALDIWNLVDTYNPDIIIGTVSWLSEDIGNMELFREDFKTFRRDRHTPGGGVLFVSKIILTAPSYGLMMILR